MTDLRAINGWLPDEVRHMRELETYQLRTEAIERHIAPALALLEQYRDAHARMADAESELPARQVNFHAIVRDELDQIIKALRDGA